MTPDDRKILACTLSLCLGALPLFAKNVTSLSGDDRSVDGELASDAAKAKTAVWRDMKLRDGDNEIVVEAGGLRSSATWRFARPVTLHVSPVGSDASGDGSAERPFATAGKARDTLRALRKQGRLDAGATVVFADGIYPLSGPLELGAEDSGNPRFPIIWKAASRAKAASFRPAQMVWFVDSQDIRISDLELADSP